MSTFSLDASNDQITFNKPALKRLTPAAAAQLGGAGLHKKPEGQPQCKKMWNEQDQLQMEIDKANIANTYKAQQLQSQSRRAAKKQSADQLEALEQERLRRQREQMDAKYEQELMAAGEYGRLQRFRAERAKAQKQAMQLRRRQEAAMARKNSLSDAGWSFFQKDGDEKSTGKKLFGSRR